MKYSIKNHPTLYKNILFRSRLEARWAAFLDIIKWKWQYEPIDLQQWTPDFFVEFECWHSECGGSHKLFAEVKPYYTIEEFENHPCMHYRWGGKYDNSDLPVDGIAVFGINPSISEFEMVHGSGAGMYNIYSGFVSHKINIDLSWNMAGNIVQFQVKNKHR